MDETNIFPQMICHGDGKDKSDDFDPLFHPRTIRNRSLLGLPALIVGRCWRPCCLHAFQNMFGLTTVRPRGVPWLKSSPWTFQGLFPNFKPALLARAELSLKAWSLKLKRKTWRWSLILWWYHRIYIFMYCIICILHVFVYMYSRCNIDMIYSTNIIDLTKMAYETLWVRIKYFFQNLSVSICSTNKLKKKTRTEDLLVGKTPWQCSFFVFFVGTRLWESSGRLPPSATRWALLVAVKGWLVGKEVWNQQALLISYDKLFRIQVFGIFVLWSKRHVTCKGNIIWRWGYSICRKSTKGRLGSTRS